MVGRRSLGLAVVAAVLGAVLPAGPVPSQAPARPNVLVVVTDDQRVDALGTMPATRRWFGAGGVTFSRAFVTTPLCCPSRASIMSGRYGHNNGVRTNRDTENLDHATTVQAALKGAGYQTATAGKFLLYWDLWQDPPHFDHWAIVNATSYYGDRFNIDGERRRVEEYSTDFIATKALEYLERFETDDDRPWYLYLAPQAPHSPFVAEPDYRDAPVPPWTPGPGVGEEDRSDKPPWVRVHGHGEDEAREERTAQLRTLYSVDDLVAAVSDKLVELGEESDTLAVFTSDNGYFWGEHRQKSKSLPYTEGIQVPLMVRYPGRAPAGTTDARFAALIDIAPTVLRAAGLDPGGVDGTSLLGPPARTEVFVEYAQDPGFRYPTWLTLRDRSSQYIEYHDPDGAVIFREYYDLAADPHQLENLLGDDDPGNDPDVDRLSARLARLATCAGRAGTGAGNPCP